MSQSSATDVLLTAAALGALVGVASLATTPQGRGMLGKMVSGFSAPQRERAPRLGDYWSGCNDARAAGVAPIFRGEPGYRDDMDGDGDGIACE